VTNKRLSLYRHFTSQFACNKLLALFLVIISSWAYIGCGSTEYVSHDVTVEDHQIVVDVPDVHVILPGVVAADSVIFASTPDTVKHGPKVKTSTNLHTHVVTVDVIMPDTTVVDHDTTQVTTTTVIEKPGFFDEIKTGILLALGLAILGGLALGGIKLAKLLGI